MANPAYVSHMSLDEATQLKVSDSVDFRLSTGQYVSAIITAKTGANLTVTYHDWKYSCDSSTDIHRFAKHESISKRSAHRFQDLEKDHLVDINPSMIHAGWKASVIKKMDPLSGQIQVMYEYENKNYIYWAHIDNTDEIALITTKSASDVSIIVPDEVRVTENEMLRMALQESLDPSNSVQPEDTDPDLQAALQASMVPNMEHKSNEEAPSTIYDEDVVNQLVNLEYDRDLCIKASSIVIDYHDINRVADQYQILKDIGSNTEEEKKSVDNVPSSPSNISRPNDKMKTFMSELQELIGMIQKRLDIMEQQDSVVDALISSSSSASLLQQSKEYALKREKDLLEQIMNLHEIDTFLASIIMIENMFNAQYNDTQRQQQKNARRTYARNISNYENKPKPISQVDSFVELLFAGTSLHIGKFGDWLQLLNVHCLKRGIHIAENSGAKGKNIERAFYKAFYVYGMQRDDGFKQMTDVLRCSLVFNNFNDLYKCFAMIERLSREYGDGEILRCKDRFDPEKIAFGYRDLLINIYCPGSKIVCEIQLHHQLFYQHKKISHALYKKARLFEQDGVNLAYNYADKHHRKHVGDKIYGVNINADHEEAKEESPAVQLLNEWNLSQYKETLIDNRGYDDVADWRELNQDALQAMGFLEGQALRFVLRVNALPSNNM